MGYSFTTPLLLILMRSLGAMAALFTNLLLAKFMDHHEFGQAMTIISLATLLSMTPFLLLDSAVIKYVRVYEATQNHLAYAQYFRFLILIFTLMSGGIIALIFGLLIYGFSTSNLGAWMPWIIALTTVPIFAWMRFQSQIANADGFVIAAAIGRSLVRPVALVLGLIVIIALGIPLHPYLISVLFLFAVLAALFIQKNAMPKRQKISQKPAVSQFSYAWVQDGISLGVNLVLIEYLVELIIVMASFVLSKPEIAQLSLLLRVMGFSRFALLAVDQAMRPKLARALAQEKLDLASNLLASAAKTRIMFAVIIGIFTWVSMPYFDQIMAGERSKFQTLFFAFELELIIIALFGSPHFVLGQSDHSRYLLISTLLSILAIFCGIIFGGYYFGILGVAFGSSIILSCRILHMHITLKKRMGFDSSIFYFLRLKDAHHA